VLQITTTTAQYYKYSTVYSTYHGAVSSVGSVNPGAEHAVVVDLVPDAAQGLHRLVDLCHHVRRVFLGLDSQIPSE
jgi:hypothetical protein